MQHYSVQISNFKSSGEADTASTKRFLLTDKKDSIDWMKAVSIVGDAVLKDPPPGIQHPTTSSCALVRIGASLKEFGEPWLSNDDYEIRKLG